MRGKIFRYIFSVAIIVLVSSLVIIMGVLYGYFSEVTKKQLKNRLSIVSLGVIEEGSLFLEGLKEEDCRVTWINEDGIILFDSDIDSSTMENHLEREEIKEAFKTGYGERVRYSNTLMERMVYCAVSLPDGTVLRLAEPQSSVITLFLGLLNPVAFVFIIAFIVSLLLAYRLATQLAEPFETIDLDNPLENVVYKELEPLLKRIYSQQVAIKNQERKLRKSRQELKSVIDGMNEGVVLVGDKGQILSINPKASEILCCMENSIGRDILTATNNTTIHSLILNVLSGISSEVKVSSGSRIYEVNGSPVVDGSVVNGDTVLFFDITEKEEREKLRREFTANVSHELKTPLHNVAGYSEILVNGMVKTEDIPKFVRNIHDETIRMTNLVRDIINLSRLDEQCGCEEWEEVNLLNEVREEIMTLEPLSKERGVSLTVEGESFLQNTVPSLFRGIIHNLVDNGIKYNKEKGKVEIAISSTKENGIVVVKDTGIGIPSEDLNRVFERFYRVSKSRSRETGGTGRGRSIVKHSVQLLKGKIEIESTIGEGTTITIILPH